MTRTLNASLIVCALVLLAGCAGGKGKAIAPSAASVVYPVEPLLTSGDSANRINLVVLGDGYTGQEQDKLSADARAWLATFTSTVPYGNYASYFNVSLVHVVSAQDGAGNGSHGFGVARDTALGAVFENANPAGQAPDYRLLVVDNDRALAVAAACNPAFTKVMVLVNDTNYGGSGGTVPVFSANAASALIALHEFGHAFGGLADEYACGDTSALPANLENFPNVTALQALGQIKWNAWIEPGLPLPTPFPWADADCLGLFSGAYYHDAGVFRPRQACRMRSLDDGFCEVCSEAIVRGVYARVSPLDSASPASPVKLDPGGSARLAIGRPVPAPDTMQVTWTLDGAAAGQGDTFDVQGLAPGAHTVSAQVADATALVRGGREGLSHIHTWSVQVGANASDVVAEPAPQQHLALRVVKDATGFRVVGRRVVDGPLPREPRRGGWTFQALGPDGEVRFSRQMEDPTELRGEFQGEGGIKGRRLGQDRPAAFEVHMPLMDTRSLAVHDGTRRTLLAAD